MWLGALGIGLLIVAFVLVRLWGTLSGPSFTVTRTPPRIVASAPEPAPEPQPTGDTAPTGDDPVAADSAATPEPAAAQEPNPPPSASAAEAAPTPSASSGARPSDAALASAIRATPIVLYSSGSCSLCAGARAFMDANGLRYSERDIDRDKNARDDLNRRNGNASVPTIEVDGELLTPGFSEQKVMAAVAASTKRRLGLKDLEIRRTQ